MCTFCYLWPSSLSVRDLQVIFGLVMKWFSNLNLKTRWNHLHVSIVDLLTGGGISLMNKRKITRPKIDPGAHLALQSAV